MKNATAITLVAILIVHLVGGGYFAAKRTVWLLMRYQGCESSSMRWENVEVKHPYLIREVCDRVPASDRILVYSDDMEECLDLAFYSFPREVEMIPSHRNDHLEGPVLKSVGDGHWAVRSSGAPAK